MTDRHNGYYVVLEHDIRDDDAEATIAAVKQIKGVLSVTPNIAGFDEHIAEMRVRTELSEKLLKVLHPEWYKDR
ncbi:MAG TPA: hypothetical protein VMT30_09490 [Candidatus Saccharimonadia bacterium]|nr:hypothetical protein [Candidatus Saccharimonadia bacterium]